MTTFLKNNVSHLKDYQLMLLGWVVVLSIMCLNCAFHSMFIANEPVDFFSSIEWSLHRFGGWLFITPVLCNALNNIPCQNRIKHFSVIAIYSIGFTLCVHILLDVTLHSVTWQESLFFNWHTHVLTYLTIALVWQVKAYVFDKCDIPKDEQRETQTSPHAHNSKSKSDSITIDGINVNFDDILFFKASGNYIEIITQHKTRLVRATMKELENRLPHSQFFRCHRSYLVNLAASRSVINARSGHGHIELNTLQQIPVSKSKRKEAHMLISA